jgi:hypothetical protein
MAPYEELYGRKCRSLVCWFEKLKRAHYRQKGYADQQRKPLEFEEGEHVFLKVTPYTVVGKAMKTKKLQPRFIGPCHILRRIGPIAYQLALPPYLSNLHDVIHVSRSMLLIPLTFQKKTISH